MPKPMFSISANGNDITDRLAGAGMQMSITDGEGYEADSLSITLDDVDGSIAAPSTGAVLRPVGGYQGAMRDYGEFIVDTVTYNGFPKTIAISAQSVAAKSAAKQREPKAFPKKEYPKYGDIFEEIAGKIGLELAMDHRLKQVANEYEAQAEENGLEFLTRIGAKLNATVTPKSGRLVVAVKGEGKSVSGASLDYILVAEGYNLLGYSMNERDKPKHSEVEATYYDRTKNAREVLKATTGLEGPKLLLKQPFQSSEEAKLAAEAHAKELIRAQADATFSIDGDPFAQAEAWVLARGVRSRVDGLWRCKVVTHNYSADGPFTCDLECEKPSGSVPSGLAQISTSTVGSLGPIPSIFLGPIELSLFL